MNLENFKAPFITRERAWLEAERVRKEHWPSGQVPVEVEEILWKFDIRIDPISSLKSSNDVDAVLLGDLTRVIVDLEEYMDERKLNRMRFSIAHELGHYVLHKEIYQNIRITSVDDWTRLVESIPEDQYGYIEYQAYEFAGRLLVPIDRLRQEISRATTKAKEAGFADWDPSGDVARDYVASNVCRVFGVSSEVIEKRILRERL